LSGSYVVKNIDFSQAVQIGQTLYLSGSIGVDPKTGQFAGEGVQEQARQVDLQLT
jgi:enamine deaminase RidA (YjgF/YER057c/UK114 family)